MPAPFFGGSAKAGDRIRYRRLQQTDSLRGGTVLCKAVIFLYNSGNLHAMLREEKPLSRAGLLSDLSC